MELEQIEKNFGIRIARNGTWFHEDGPIRRIELVKLFAMSLSRLDNGEYWLVTPTERGRIIVDDVPFVAVEMTVEGVGEEQVLMFRTNLDEWVEAGPDHPIWIEDFPQTGESIPYIEVREGLAARILRSVYYEMVDRCVPQGPTGEEAGVGIWSHKHFFMLSGPLGA